MRSALLASLALTATLTSAFAPSVAEACGGYMAERAPAVFAVDDHNVLDEGTNVWQRRAFVLLRAASAATDRTWTMLAPGTFDTTQIADVPDPTQSTTFTLVGPSGSRVVSSNRHALLAKRFNNRTEQSAIEVGIDQDAQFQIAVLGTQPTAKWIEAIDAKPTRQTVAWVKGQGLDASYVYVTRIKGTTLQVISAHQPNAIALTSFVINGKTSLGAYSGTAIGALELSGKRYVLLETNGLITPVAV